MVVSMDGTPDPPLVGVYGGSFNPPHVAHQMVCLLALGVGRMEAVWVIPSFEHAFDKQLAGFEHRLAMCRIMARPFGSRVQVLDVEREIGGKSRTLVTVKHLRQRYPQHRFSLVVGSDILDEAHRWYGWDRLMELVTLFVVPRGEGETDFGYALPGLSSTCIRETLGAGGDVSAQIPGQVYDYIREHGLYRG
jgi:nicotinate-nucleotide adenylyltransferase